MSRDKQIEEMANEIMKVVMQNRNMRQVAETLYNAGYRKASDDARKIFEEIEEGVKAGISALQFETNPIHRKVKHETYSSIMRYIKTLEDKYESEG